MAHFSWGAAKLFMRSYVGRTMMALPPRTVSNWRQPAVTDHSTDSLIVVWPKNRSPCIFPISELATETGAVRGCSNPARYSTGHRGINRPSQFVIQRQKLNSINRCIYIDIRKLVSSLCRRVAQPYRVLRNAKLARFDSRWQHHQLSDSQLETWATLFFVTWNIHRSRPGHRDVC